MKQFMSHWIVSAVTLACSFKGDSMSSRHVCTQRRGGKHRKSQCCFCKGILSVDFSVHRTVTELTVKIQKGSLKGEVQNMFKSSTLHTWLGYACFFVVVRDKRQRIAECSLLQFPHWKEMQGRSFRHCLSFFCKGLVRTFIRLHPMQWNHRSLDTFYLHFHVCSRTQQTEFDV